MRAFTAQDMDDIRNHFPLEDCLPPPALEIDPASAQAFEALFRETLQAGPGRVIDYRLAQPKYLFLEYLAQQHGTMLHGSPLQGLELIRPIRNTGDGREFGNQAAIYATQDPLWALFFAVLVKSVLQGPIMNGAIQLSSQDGALIRRYYYCLDEPALRAGPWKPGAIYIMPGEGFEVDPDMADVTVGPYKMVCTHWLYRGEVQPLARLVVAPEDFPFYNRVWGYDLTALDERMQAESIAGWPFLNDETLYPIRPK